jgi:DNA gyrase subunit B
MAKAKAKSANTYDEDSIQVHKGLAGVRLNAGMYMGELGDSMMYRMGKEAVENSRDEYEAGRNNAIYVAFNNKTSEYVFADCAQGIPVGMKTVEGKKVSALTVILTELHAGGKFDVKAYQTSGGTHGVGISAVNALSKELEVWTCREDQWYYQSFSCGKETSPVKKVPDTFLKKKFGYLLPLKKKFKRLGTIIRLVPDQSVISVDASRTSKLKTYTQAVLEEQKFADYLKFMSTMNSKLYIGFLNLETNKEQVFYNDKGLGAVVSSIISDHDLEPLGKPFEFDGSSLKVAIQWSNHYDSDLFRSYVNSSPTIDHGTHVNGFRAAMSKALKNYLPKKAGKFKPEDLYVGAVAIINWKMNSAQFSGQVKDKLVSKIDNEVCDLLTQPLTDFFAKNKTLAKQIIKRASDVAASREDLAKTMKGMSEVKKGGSKLPIKLYEAPDCKPHERELYFVEGDSAGGTAKNARGFNQEVLKLGGKIPNALNVSLSALLSNDRIQDMLNSLGVDIKSLDVKADNPTFSTKNLRVAVAMLLADADADGSHINVLITAFFYKLMPDFIKEGRLFVVDAQLYNALVNGVHYSGNTMEECLAKLPKNAPKGSVFRAKGWGETDADLLEAIAFDINNRKLIQIEYGKVQEDLAFYRSVVGEDASARRQLLGLSSND